MIRLITACLFALVFAGAAQSQQRLSVKPDATAKFRVSSSGITRISVVGDRISDLVSNSFSEDVLQVKFDEKTGDAFLRYTDPRNTSDDSGFLVTAQGVTVNYEMTPDRASSQTVLITIDRPRAAAASEPEIAFATNTGSAAGGAGGYAGGLVDCARAIFATHIQGRPVPALRNGAVVKTVRSGACRGRILVARAGKSGGAVRPQSFHRAGKTLGVLAVKPVLAPGERTFVIELTGG